MADDVRYFFGPPPDGQWPACVALTHSGRRARQQSRGRGVCQHRAVCDVPYSGGTGDRRPLCGLHVRQWERWGPTGATSSDQGPWYSTRELEAAARWLWPAPAALPPAEQARLDKLRVGVRAPVRSTR